MTYLWLFLAWCLLSLPLALIIAPLMHSDGDS